MAFRVEKEYTSLTARQRVALRNSDIPGRKSKYYQVSYYKYREQPAVTKRSYWDGRVIDGVISHREHATQMIPESSTVSWAPSSEFGSLDEVCMADLFKRCRKARDTGLNAAVFIAELPATMKMFVSTARRITGALKAVKRGRLEVARQLLGVQKGGKPGSTAANNWLELQYGWKPLLSDIDSGARKLAKVLHDPRKSWKVATFASRERKVDNALTMLVGDVNDFPPGKQTVYETTTVRAGVSFTISNEMLAHAASLGFTNPALVVWELVPLSFVVDWLIGVGDWLEDFTTFQGMQFQDGFVTVVGKTTETYAFPQGGYTSYRQYDRLDESGNIVHDQLFNYVESIGASTIVSEISGFRRNPMTQFPQPVTPQLKFGFSVAKFVTSLSLARQRM